MLRSDTKLASPPEQLTETMVFFSSLPLKFKTFRLSKNNSKSSTSIIPSLFKKADEIRDRLKRNNVDLEDTPQETIWKISGD